MKFLWTFIFEIAADMPVHSSEVGLETNSVSIPGSAHLFCGCKGSPKATLQPVTLGWFRRVAAVERLAWKSFAGPLVKRAELLPQSGSLLELAEKLRTPEPLTLRHGQWCLVSCAGSPELRLPETP